MDDKGSPGAAEWNAAFSLEDREQYSIAGHNLKRRMEGMIEGHFYNRDLMCGKASSISPTTEEISNPRPDSSTQLAQDVNCFFAHFGTAESDNGTESTLDVVMILLLTLQTHEVRRIFILVNIKKAEGPDGRVIRGCPHQLVEAVTDIFNLSLSQAVVPTCLKSDTTIPEA